MEWNIILHEKDKYVEIITSGIADKDGSMNMAKAIQHEMRNHHITKALIDHRNIADIVSKPFDIYNRSKIFQLISIFLKIKIAEIIKPEHIDHFRFFETVCLNRGYQISVFQDREKALDWLLS